MNQRHSSLISKLFLIVTIVTFNISFSQTSKGTYKWLESVPMKRCDYLGRPYQGNRQMGELSIQGQLFKVVEVKGDSLIIIIVDYINSGVNSYTYNLLDSTASNITKSENQAYFKISLADLDNYAQSQTKIASTMKLGAITFPFKFRPQKDFQDFSGSFNIGGAVGLTIKHYEWRKSSWTFLGSYALSNIYLDSITTTSNQVELNKTNNFNGWSVAFGVMLEFDKVQVALYLGSDRINKMNQSRYGWKYQGKTWFSFGFGLALFSPFDDKKVYSNAQNP